MRQSAHLCVAAVLLVCFSGAMATTLTRMAVNDTNARCLDGSPYYYYISVGTASSRFYLYHQGGGWCQDLNECAGRAKSPLGSSSTWGATQDMGDGMSRDANANPLMKDWTFVYLPYCDGGSFTGDATSPSSPLLYFRGFKIREAVVASLRTYHAFDAATDLVVGGCSAGGLAAYLSVDWYAKQVPKANAKGMIDSGFFLDGNYNRDGKPDYEGRMANLYNMMNSKAGINPLCNAKIGYKCLFAYHALPFITTPIIAMNSVYDASMGDGQCGHSGIIFNWNDPASVNSCGNYIRSLFKKLLASPSAAFLDSCRHHCGEWNSIKIEGYLSSTAMNTWFTQGDKALPNNGYMDQGQVFPCNSCCSNGQLY